MHKKDQYLKPPEVLVSASPPPSSIPWHWLHQKQPEDCQSSDSNNSEVTLISFELLFFFWEEILPRKQFLRETAAVIKRLK